jgi:hypothetical protein
VLKFLKKERMNMKVTIFEGPHTDEALKKCYQYILDVYKKSMQRKLREALKAGKTEEEFWKDVDKA